MFVDPDVILHRGVHRRDCRYFLRPIVGLGVEHKLTNDSPFGDDLSTARGTAFAKIRSRVGGALLNNCQHVAQMLQKVVQARPDILDFIFQNVDFVPHAAHSRRVGVPAFSGYVNSRQHV